MFLYIIEEKFFEEITEKVTMQKDFFLNMPSKKFEAGLALRFFSKSQPNIHPYRLGPYKNQENVRFPMEPNELR